MNVIPEFDPDLLSRYDVSGPRYTSYPTAPHFRADFDEAKYRAHAMRSNDDPIPRPLSLYVHIPFCSSPCFYCGCNRVITRDHAKADAYLARLGREIALQAALFDTDRKVTQLHLGGGTPNFLDALQMAELTDQLGNAFRFAAPSEREFSIEIDPRHADDAYLGALARLGFDRVSFGVQDLNPDVQAAINRIQPAKLTLAAIASARAHGFRSVSVDLIYGLPKQTFAGFDATLDTVIGAFPDRIALYSYAHLPEVFKPQRRIKASDMPSPHDKLGLFGLAINRLAQAGYRHIGMDHFALPTDELVRAQDAGTLQRNFQGYSTHAECDLVGLGMSAIGRVGDCYVQNARDLVGYYAALDNGRLPIVKGLSLTFDDVVRGEIIQRLMCDGRVFFADVERRHSITFGDYFARELVRLHALANDGLVELKRDRVEITPAGRLLVRVVAMAFDAWIARPGETGAAENVARFSRVI